MFQKIKDYFAFSKSERNGIIVLLLILLLIIIAPFLFPYFIKEEAPDMSAFKKEIDAFEKSLKKNDAADFHDTSYARTFDYSDIDKSSAELKLHPFLFDPNGLPEEKWKEMGMTDKQIKTIKNYEAKGGKFYNK